MTQDCTGTPVSSLTGVTPLHPRGKDREVTDDSPGNVHEEHLLREKAGQRCTSHKGTNGAQSQGGLRGLASPCSRGGSLSPIFTHKVTDMRRHPMPGGAWGAESQWGAHRQLRSPVAPPVVPEPRFP